MKQLTIQLYYSPQVAFSPDGKTLASGSRDTMVRLWDVPSSKLRACCAGHSRNISALAFHPSGGALASGSDDNSVILWDCAAGRKLGATPGRQPVGWCTIGDTSFSTSWHCSVRCTIISR